MQNVVDDEGVDDKIEEIEEEEYKEGQNEDLVRVRTNSVQASVMKIHIVTHFVYCFMSCIGYRGIYRRYGSCTSLHDGRL